MKLCKIAARCDKPCQEVYEYIKQHGKEWPISAEMALEQGFVEKASKKSAKTLRGSKHFTGLINCKKTQTRLK